MFRQANNDKYKPERTTTHEYDPIQGAMKQRVSMFRSQKGILVDQQFISFSFPNNLQSKPPSPQDVSQVPPLRSAPGLRPPSN